MSAPQPPALPTVEAAVATLSRVALAELDRVGMFSPAGVEIAGAMAVITAVVDDHSRCPEVKP